MRNQQSMLPQRNNPFWYRLIKAHARASQALGLQKPLSAEHMLAQALRRQQRDRFEDISFCEGLEAFVAAANNEARLNGFGRLTIASMVRMALKQRLRLEAWREQHPDIGQQQVRRPLIIVGMPRTGTTFLHQLLYQDKQFRSPRRFEIELPVPPPREDALQHDRRVKQVQFGLDVIHKIVPHFMAVHPMAAPYPDECQQITQYQFCSMGLAHIMDAPSFQQWLLAHDYRLDLAFHKRFLQHLQSAWHHERWLLKSPAHVQYLPTLLETYPDAMIIHTHRDPAAVMASVSSLSWIMQDVFSDYTDPLRTGQGQLSYFNGVTRMCLEGRERLAGSDAFVDVRYPELIVDPMATVRAVYRHFELALTPSTIAAMEVFLARNQQGKRGKHGYDAAIFGVDGLDQIDVYRQYRQRFGV
jgi:hypothetical protein